MLLIVSVALSEQNVEAAPGSFGEQGNQSFQYTIRYKGRLQEANEFEHASNKVLITSWIEANKKSLAFMEIFTFIPGGIVN